MKDKTNNILARIWVILTVMGSVCVFIYNKNHYNKPEPKQEVAMPDIVITNRTFFLPNEKFRLYEREIEFSDDGIVRWKKPRAYIKGDVDEPRDANGTRTNYFYGNPPLGGNYVESNNFKPFPEHWHAKTVNTNIVY